MAKHDPLYAFERLVARMGGDAPPQLNVAPQVMRRIRTQPTPTDRVFELELLTVGSCAAALAVALLGFKELTGVDGLLETFVRIVPPIGF